MHQSQSQDWGHFLNIFTSSLGAAHILLFRGFIVPISRTRDSQQCVWYMLPAISHGSVRVYSVCLAVSYTKGIHFCRQRLYIQDMTVLWTGQEILCFYGAWNFNFMLAIGPYWVSFSLPTYLHKLICFINMMLGGAPEPSRMVLGPTQHHIPHYWSSPATEFVTVPCKTCTVK
jgi:hypothetical protein